MVEGSKVPGVLREFQTFQIQQLSPFFPFRHASRESLRVCDAPGLSDEHPRASVVRAKVQALHFTTRQELMSFFNHQPFSGNYSTHTPFPI
jgi:hypothetical protein